MEVRKPLLVDVVVHELVVHVLLVAARTQANAKGEAAERKKQERNKKVLISKRMKSNERQEQTNHSCEVIIVKSQS